MRTSKRDSTASIYKRLRAADTPEWRQQEIARPFVDKLMMLATLARQAPRQTVDRSEVEAMARLAKKVAHLSEIEET